MIIENWLDKKLKDIAEFSKERININEVRLDNYISTENMQNNRGGIVDAQKLPNSKTVLKFEEEQILISNIRPYFKKIWFSKYIGGCSNDILVLKIKDDNVCKKFLYYLLSSDAFFDYVMGTSIGTKMPRGDRKAIMNYGIQLPPLEEQKSIAHILSTLDKKIEVNNKINKNLEEMAQAIFKHWFVDFEFPNEDREPYKSSGGEMVESELGMIPKGWKAKKLSEVCSVKDGTHDSPKPSDTGYPLITSKHLKGTKIDFIDAKLISKTDYDNVNKRSKVDRFDILISMIGTVGNVYLVQDEVIDFAIKNIGLFKTSENLRMYEYIYYYIKTPFIKQRIKERMAGSTQQYISLTELRIIPLLVPSKKVLNNFKTITNSILNSIYNNSQEIQMLEFLRNTLIPKLMSGEIRVPLESEGEV